MRNWLVEAWVGFLSLLSIAVSSFKTMLLEVLHPIIETGSETDALCSRIVPSVGCASIKVN